jgi:hypothetical protein
VAKEHQAAVRLGLELIGGAFKQTLPAGGREVAFTAPLGRMEAWWSRYSVTARSPA